MPQPVVAQTGEQWMRQTERRIALLERRPVQTGDRFTTDGIMWSTTVPEEVRFITPTFQHSWVDYGGQYHDGGYIVTSTGIVCLTGLIKNGSGVAFNLPAGLRPDGGTFLTGVINSGGQGFVQISGGGDLTPSSASWSSLAGIMYPADGVLTWTPITTFVNNFASYHAIDPTHPVAAYAVDQYGRLWFRGAMYRTTGVVPVADVLAFTLPADLAPYQQIHLAEASNAGFASYHAVLGSGVTNFYVKTGTAGVAWLALAKAAWVVESIWPHTRFQQLSMDLTDWTNLIGGFPVASIAVFPDGIAMMAGLINAGTVGPTARALYTPNRMSPDNAVGPKMTGDDLFLANSNNSVARHDITRIIGGVYGAASTLVPVSGPVSWRSLNGTNYLIGS